MLEMHKNKKTLLIWLNPGLNATIHLSRNWAQTFSFGTVHPSEIASLDIGLVQNILSLSIGVEVRI